MNTNTETTRTESPRAAKLRANQEARRAHVRDLISKANGSDPAARSAARAALALIVGQAIAYHSSGKIEGLHSLDTACRNNDFCPAMQACGDPCVICTYCYTLSMWDSATAAHAIIGEILSQVEFTREEAALVPVPGLIVRYNSDGEIINETHARNLIRIAAAHQLTTFAVWTKRPALLNQAITEEGKPGNLVCGISSIRINTPADAPFPWVDFVFTVYTPEGMRAALARREHECNGRKCIACGFRCYHAARTNGGPLYVAEALRKPSKLSKTEFARRIEEIDRATLNT